MKELNFDITDDFANWFCFNSLILLIFVCLTLECYAKKKKKKEKKNIQNYL